MAFIVKKKIHGKEYYYLNENKRIDGKVKTKTLAYLGKTKQEAIKKSKEIIERMNKEKEKVNEELNVKLVHETLSIDELANFCKRKGLVFKSSEIYGGFSGFWDFGPLGIELFKNLKDEWWNFFVRGREEIVGMEGSIISHPKTWEASGHLSSFKDIAVVCKKCKKAAKIDESGFGKVKCECGGEYERIGEFNLLFKTNIGALDSTESYLRGETAQGMFLDFKIISQISRMKLPFGIAQIGKCFRNEIAPRDFLFRSREFHIAEIEFFINPKEKKCPLLNKEILNLKFRFLDKEAQKSGKEELKEATIKDLIDKGVDEWQAYWLAEQLRWFNSIGISEIRVREHRKDELSHYSSSTFDIDYEYSFGSKEIAGNADRGQFDLKQHEKFSKEKMEILDEETNMKVIPRVIEPTFGLERVFLAILSGVYHKNHKGETVLQLPLKLAPIKVAVFPIVKREDFEKIAEDIVKKLKLEWNVVYDKSGSIGRRYARNDEIGTPYCITIDEDSLKHKDVTIRERGTGNQVRVKIEILKEIIKKLINSEIKFNEAGKVVYTRKKHSFTA